MTARITPISRAVTLREVAEAAGVSTAAVSQALNNTGTLSEATRERIKATAHKLGYVPNQQAASLRRKSTRSIGFVMNAETDLDSEQRWGAYYQRVLYALVTTAGKRGYTVTVIPDNQPELILSSRIDMLYYVDAPADDALIPEAVRLGIPVITNDYVDVKNSPISIDSGYHESTSAALDLLAAGGATEIALLTEDLGYPADEVPEKSYLDWCKQNGRKPVVVRGNYGRTDLENCVDELLAADVDGIYSFYEEGPRIQAYLETRGKRVPEDVQLVAACAGNCERNAEHRVSSVVLHPELGPELIFDELVAAAEGKSETRVHVKLPWELREHGSTR